MRFFIVILFYAYFLSLTFVFFLFIITIFSQYGGVIFSSEIYVFLSSIRRMNLTQATAHDIIKYVSGGL